jgi:hypothetical protein
MTDVPGHGIRWRGYARPMVSEHLPRWVAVLAANLRQEYPSKIAHELASDADVAPPRELTPVFSGCYDWHSAVHSHWALVRARRLVDADLRTSIEGALDASITEAGCAAEEAYLARRPGFEMPYGIAWLLTLGAELAIAGDDRALGWRGRLDRLLRLARDHFLAWARRLPVPIRSGEHTQSAFALGLVLDAARAAGDDEAVAIVTGIAHAHHGADRGAPVGFEPSAYDFLSPVLAAASLLARILPPDDFAAWLTRYCPALGHEGVLEPVASVDRNDGKLAHWDGLNLSRAWMLDIIVAALPGHDPRVDPLRALALRNGEAGVAGLLASTYAGSHWLPSFAIYWLSGPIRRLVDPVSIGR